MKPHRLFNLQNSKLVALSAALLSMLIVSSAISIVSSTAQSTEERELEDKIPKHLPIKVKIKKEKEKAFKDLNNEKWLRDFELEITNTGQKPIYFLSLSITLPEITAPDGRNMGFTIHYGRSLLGNIKTKAEPDDIPIRPGETYVFSFPDIQVTSWARFRRRENKPNPKKLILNFQILSFGDATGFAGHEGTALPHPQNGRSSLERCKPDLSDASDTIVEPVSWPKPLKTFSTDNLPASFSRKPAI